MSPSSANSSFQPSSSSWREEYPFQSHFLDLEGVKYHYLDESPASNSPKASPLLMVHGNPTWSFYYRNLVKAFAPKHRVVVPDHVGCGLSDKPQEYEYRLARHIENICKLIEYLDLQDIWLAVHDWGGAIGLGAAVEMPERFSRLTLFNTAAYRDRRIPLRIRVCRMPYFGESAVRKGNAFARAALTMATNKPERMTPTVQAGLLAPYDNWENRVAIQRFVEDIPLNVNHPSYCRLQQVEAGLAKLQHLPCQLIWGMQDWCFSPHFLKRFKTEFFPDAEVHRFEQAGHYIVEDAHEEIVPLMESFYEKETESEHHETTKPSSPLPSVSTISWLTKRHYPEADPTIHGNQREEPSQKIGNIAQLLEQQAKARPNALAIAAPGKRNSEGIRQYETLTYAELDTLSHYFAVNLLASGIPRGSRLALMVRFGPEFIIATFGLLKAGFVVILIDPAMGIRPMVKCLEEAKPAGFVAIPTVHKVVRILKKRFPEAKWNVTVGKSLFSKNPTFDQLLQKPSGDLTLERTKSSDPAAIIFTSGSTGTPKGVEYRHANFAAQVTEIQSRFAIEPGEINLPGFPLFGLFDAAMGVTTILPDMDPTRPAKVNPAKIIEAMNDWRTTQAFGSPAMWHRIGDYCQSHGTKMPMQRVLSAGAPVPPKTLRKITEALPDKGLMHTPYGATESLPVASIDSETVLQETAGATSKGAGTCVGSKFPGIQWNIIEIVEGPLTEESINPLPHGEIGELMVQGDVVTPSYFRKPEATEKAKVWIDGKCWHRMGDAGYLDKEGRFWFCGRIAHRVKTADRILYPVPLEGIFNQHPKVYRSALVGVGTFGTQVPVLVVETYPNQKPKSLAQKNKLILELQEIAMQHEETKAIQYYLLHPSFPVDIRHNAKIFREKIALWATKHLKLPGTE
ncbi:AMP-dependent synthetase/ligase in alkane synthesis cluster [Planctomycetales bacterium 10988]|nr:AMP-dependent synthetase/ligase in alkane synthesis cluster [Planctomycetales bacterium 10988]